MAPLMSDGRIREIVAVSCLLAALVVPCRTANAHPFSITKGNIWIRDDHLEMKLEVMVEDIFVFQELQLDLDAEDDRLDTTELRKGIERHRAYIYDNLILYDSENDPLPYLIYRVDPGELDPKGIPVMQFMAQRVYYFLECTFEKPVKALGIFQTFARNRIAYSSALLLTLVWDGREQFTDVYIGKGILCSFPREADPSEPSPGGTDAEKKAERERVSRERRERLGITSYSAIYTFLYIDDVEVRHEILIPLATLETWLPIEREDTWLLRESEQEAARERIFGFFRDHLPVEIDGIPVKPLLTRLDFYGLDFQDFALQAPSRPVKTYAARVGIILSYTTKGAPGRVRVIWDLFSPYVRRVRSAAFPFEDSLTHEFTPKNPAFEWTSPRREQPSFPGILRVVPPSGDPTSIPVLSVAAIALSLLLLLWKRSALVRSRAGLVVPILLVVALAGWPFARVEVTGSRESNSGWPTEKDGRFIFESLHKNVYRAFDYRGESDVYDVLANSVDGDLLTDLYLQVKKGLVMKEQGGAVSRAREIFIESCDLEPGTRADSAPSRGFLFRCTWTVKGTVEHWGHIHARTNRYKARFTIQARNGAWKITDMDGLEQSRVKFETVLREGM